ncbi:MAG: trypsin-like peptidase domain-containing protein [Bacteroidetes bacterium]|nr:trypsin-like peptidase domain-containing protein [Bacteroidota bacterium]
MCLLATPMQGQIQSPGKPVGNFSQLKGADVIYLLPPLHPLEVDACTQDNLESFSKPLQFAIERPLSISPLTQGVWTAEEGCRIWRAHVISPGAVSVGLVFDRYRLVEGVKLLLYDPEMGHIKGAYTSLNNKSSGIFAVGHIPGEELIIELQVPENMDDYGEFSLGSLSHAFLPVAIKGVTDGRFGRSQPCEIDMNCVEGADWQLEKRSVVRLYTTTQYCTGVLLNNTAYDGAPLLLTAKHCIESQEGAEKTIFKFNYESASCFGGDGSVDMSISSSDSLSVGDSIDFSLVRLSLSPPEDYNAFYAGWDLSDPQAGPTTTIHHPEGDVKKISFDFDAPEACTIQSQIPSQFWDHLSHSFWLIKQWDVGSTEPGSSGSPLFTPQGQVIGVLSFGSAKCGDSIGYDAEKERIIFSKTVNKDDYYTKLDVAWDYHSDSSKSLKPWLDPTDSGIRSIEGLHPGSVQENEIQRGRDFKLYPNPAGNTLWFYSRSLPEERISYMVYDLRGTLLLQGEGLLPGPVMVDVGRLRAGLYLLLLESGAKREILKFVISR